MKEIFTYQEHVRDDAFAERSPGFMRRYGTVGFFRDKDDSTCPFCNCPAEQVHYERVVDYPDWLDGGEYTLVKYVWSCPQCGWWRSRTNKKTDGTIDAVSAIVRSAVLKKYDLSSKDLPLTVLQQHLREKYEDVIHIHDKQMEKLVQSVFAEYFNCEVEHIGKSHDGGVDLLLIQADSPTVIQVKRRRSLPHVESVSGVRELIGATLLKESKNCIFVSTSSKFSEPSKEAAQRAVELGIVESYELYDFQRFSSALKLVTPAAKNHWKGLINEDT
ncbi:restriction endonuclease [Janthinobacterium sp. LB2P70]|uniref:restriction endonuclease n=1 Tax=Janthinobacterium sp. LB2P70 TaxID=3424197 RepID=UPI003F24F524